jgi:MFS family permease
VGVAEETPPGGVAVGRLRNDPAFRRYFAAHAVSVTGTAITLVALPLAMFQRTGSAGLTAALTAVEVVPYLLFGLVAGAVSDRANRRAVMVGADLVAAAALASIPVASQLGMLTTGHLLATAAVVATSFVWFDAANFGALPTLVGRERVVRASGALWTFDSLAMIAGPAIGGLLASVLSPSAALGLDAATYLVSAGLLARLAGITRAPATTSATTPTSTNTPTSRWRTTVTADVREGLRYLWAHPIIRALTVAGFGNSVSFGAVLGLTVPYAVTQLGLADDDWQIGLLVAAGACGSLAAALVVPRLGGSEPSPRWNSYALVGAATSMLAIALTSTFPVALVLWPFWQACVQTAILNGIAYRLRHVPDHLLGRVNVVARMVAWGGQPFGAALGGLAATRFDIRTSLLLLVAPVAIAAAASWQPLHRPAGGVGSS